MDKTLRILILEDNPADAELIQFELQEADIDFTAKVVTTEKDYIREIKAFSPDIILSDYDLPQYNGTAALSEANSRCPEVPFILVTGAVSEERAIEILTSGAKDYVMKSRLSRLAPAVRRVMAETEEQRARQRAEIEVYEASRYARSLIEASLDPLVTISTDGKIMDVNLATEEATGIPRSRLVGTDFADYFTEPRRARLGYARAFQNGSVKDYPLTLRHVSGHETDVLYNATTYKNEMGDVKGVFAAARDITELKKAEKKLRRARADLEKRVEKRTAELQTEIEERKTVEEALRRSEQRERERALEFESLLDAVPTPIFIAHDKDCIHLTGNRAAGALLKLPSGTETSLSAPADVKPGHFRALKDGRELANEELPAQRAASGIPVKDFEFDLVFDDGTIRHVVGYGTPLFDEVKRPRGAVHVLFDITERKRAEEALRASEERQRLVLQSSALGTFEVDLATGETVWNATEFELLGLRPDQFPASPATLFRFVHPDDLKSLQDRWDDAKRTGTLDTEFRIIRADGQMRWLAGKGRFLLTSDPQGNEPASGGRAGRFMGVNFDITEHKRIGDSLRENESVLRSFFDSFGVMRGIIEVVGEDDVRHIIDNVEAARFGGRTPEEMKNRMGSELGETRSVLRTWVDGCLDSQRTGKPVAFEYPDQRGGKEAWLKTVVSCLSTPHRPPRFAYAVQDITGLRKAEEDLRRSLAAERAEREKLAALIDSIQDEVWFADNERRFKLANSAALKEFNLGPEGLNVERFATGLEVYRPDGSIRPVDEAPPLRALRGEVVRNQEEIIRTPLYGELRYRQVSASPVMGADGKIIGSVSVVRDITERRRAEESLKQSETQADVLVRYAPTGIYEIDYRVPRFISVNDAMCQILGYTREELLSMNPADLLDEESRALFAKRVRRHLSGEKIDESVEYRVRKKDGTSIDAILNLSFDPGHESGKVLVIAHDITARKKDEEKLREKTGRLEAVNKELESFSYSVSHDLRAPLRAIDGYLRMILKRQADHFDEETRRQFDRARECAKSMGHLIDDLMALSKLSRQDLHAGSLDVRRLIEQAWEELRRENPDRNMALKMNHLPVGWGDGGLMNQVIVNLLSNTVKFSRCRDAALVEAGGYGNGGETVYYVKDNGVGFDMQYHDKLFGVFQRLHGAEEYEGTGIGLSLVQRIVHRHGGRVWAEGKVNEGATFYFTLPAGR